MKAEVVKNGEVDVLRLFVEPHESKAIDGTIFRAMSESASAEKDSATGEAVELPDGYCEFGGAYYDIPVEAIASYGMLLGSSSDVDTVKMLMHIRDNGEPLPDPETGRNAWTSAYEQLEYESIKDNPDASFMIDRMPAVMSKSVLDGIDETRVALGFNPRGMKMMLASEDEYDLSDVEGVINSLSSDVSEAKDRFMSSLVPKDMYKRESSM